MIIRFLVFNIVLLHPLYTKLFTSEILCKTVTSSRTLSNVSRVTFVFNYTLPSIIESFIYSVDISSTFAHFVPSNLIMYLINWFLYWIPYLSFYSIYPFPPLIFAISPHLARIICRIFSIFLFSVRSCRQRGHRRRRFSPGYNAFV